EGFAEFMPGQYWYTKLGSHAEDDYYADEYRQFMALDARRSMPLAANASNNIYPKGALVLRMLERYLGRERFWAAVHLYLTRHAFANATTEGFRQAVIDATGENLDWFFTEWFYDAGYPHFTVAAKYDSAAHTVALDVKQTQQDDDKADSTGFRYETPDVFRMPITVRVGTASGDVVARAWLDAREQTITVDSVMSEPTMVIFDDGNTILKTLNFDEPTAWLATQLERDPDLWNREWVIGELADRTKDPLAAQALAKAATSADYDLTRAQAAEVLATFPAKTAFPALAEAMKDTSARVRKAAVGSLGSMGGDDAVALARAAFANDPSYEVRAAALVAVARTDREQRHALIAQGLDTPSYRDAIQGAALLGILISGDTTFNGKLESMLGAGSDVASLLGALASRGDSTALDILVRHLDDEREYVRQWVVASVSERLSPAAALARLRPVANTLKHDDTKKAIGALIGKLEKQQAGGA
ncbi:MAG TPA: HEAT repeat domain-containing protein, partial [Gemmatimonadaceae bacterium]|nr:HEAT repeat domain-containing protein [Gemmatimonadaceae bacterium]